jgi:hypothetical protein
MSHFNTEKTMDWGELYNLFKGLWGLQFSQWSRVKLWSRWASCGTLGRYQCLGRTYYLQLFYLVLKTEAVYLSETLVASTMLQAVTFQNTAIWVIINWTPLHKKSWVKTCLRLRSGLSCKKSYPCSRPWRPVGLWDAQEVCRTEFVLLEQ